MSVALAPLRGGGGVPAFYPSQAEAAPAGAAAPLVFDGVTVVNVENGQLIPQQRVVITGPRIDKMGPASAVPIPAGAQVVDARGKYLIPGLWDMHVHPENLTSLVYPMLLAAGVTGIRDPGSPVPLDSLRLLRREILAGTRIGPPRQLLSGQSIAYHPDEPCDRSTEHWKIGPQTCVADSADARHYVDSLKAAGADMIKPRSVRAAGIFFVIAAESRRLGIPFGGHLEAVTPIDASDSGAVIADHLASRGVGGGAMCIGKHASMAVAQCQLVAEHFRRNGTWFVPTLITEDGEAPRYIMQRFKKVANAFWTGSSLPHGNWLSDAANPDIPSARSDSSMKVLRDVGMPLIAGTDSPELQSELAMQGLRQPMFTLMPTRMVGFSLHAELATYVAQGLTPLQALQTATLNPGKLLRAIHVTDALGTVAPGKLADLVLLDANPLEDITNTTTIRAVVANGRYYNRAALDSILTQCKAMVH